MGDVSRTSTPQLQLLPPVAQHYGGKGCHESNGRGVIKYTKEIRKGKEKKENSAVGSSESLTHPPLADLVFDLLKKPRSLGRLEVTPVDVSGNES